MRHHLGSTRAGRAPPRLVQTGLEWIDELEKRARSVGGFDKIGQFQSPRHHVIKLCILVKLMVRMLQEIDDNDKEQAQKTLEEFKKELGFIEKEEA